MFDLKSIPFGEYIVESVIIIIVAFIISRVSYHIIIQIWKKFDFEITTKHVTIEFTKYFIYIIAIFAILHIFKVDIRAILVSLGVIGVSVGLAAKDLTSNILSGFFLLIDKTVKIGEFIEVGNVSGYVKKVSFRNTTLLTPDKKIINIPNSILSKNPYISHTFLEQHRIDFDIIIPFDIDSEKFKKEIVERISKINWVLDKPKPKIIYQEIIDTGVHAKIMAWTKDYKKRKVHRFDIANETLKVINECKVEGKSIPIKPKLKKHKFQ